MFVMIFLERPEKKNLLSFFSDISQSVRVFLTNCRGELLKQLCSCSCSNMLINLTVCIQSLMGPVL